MTCTNPVIYSDFPDPDVIRVGDTYYMASTSMHFMPGSVILRSFDLANWEYVTHVYKSLEDYPAARLEGGKAIYGSGMWAPCLRYHEGRFYLLFGANDTHKAYLFTAARAEGPWRRRRIEGFYHDPSLLFEDKRVFVMHGNTRIRITELEPNLARPKPDGLDREIIRDREGLGLGYEGCHLYKIGGSYYALFIHWPNEGTKRRKQVCFKADSLEGEWTGKTILDDDMGFFNQGVAQGGLVDTPDGAWYAMLFQDRGALGRMPVLIPASWEDGYPVLHPVPKKLEVSSTRPGHIYESLFQDDDFNVDPNKHEKVQLKEAWEWNHIPARSAWSLTKKPGYLIIKSSSVVPNISRARNTLTQRVGGPCCEVSVILDGSALKEGDWAGLSMFQSNYAFIGLTRREGKLHVAMVHKEREEDPAFNTIHGKRLDFSKGIERACFADTGNQIELKMCGDFRDLKDEVRFYFKLNGAWAPLGPSHKLHFRLDHFTGCRAGLFIFSTIKPGGKAYFRKFRNKQGLEPFS